MNLIEHQNDRNHSQFYTNNADIGDNEYRTCLKKLN